jgi:hypothetical protein
MAFMTDSRLAYRKEETSPLSLNSSPTLPHNLISISPEKCQKSIDPAHPPPPLLSMDLMPSNSSTSFPETHILAPRLSEW